MTPFATSLAHYRRSRGLQQQQLAHIIGISPCYFSAMENGRKGPPSRELLESISANLALSQHEKIQLCSSAKQSQRTRQIPSSAGLHEYYLIDELWDRIGTLSEVEASTIRSLLKINTQKGGGD